MTRILTQQMSDIYYPDATDPTMNIDERGFHDVDMLQKIQSEIEPGNKEEAEQSYAPQPFNSETYDEDVHARMAEHLVENQIEEGQHVIGGVAVPASASSGTASADSLGALATPQWFTHKVDGVIPQQLMFNLADEREDEVYVSSDVIGGKKGAKKFTSSGKHAHLAAKVLKCSVEESPCTLYEMIRENTPCRFYVDVEWEESEFSGYSRLNSVYNAVCTKFTVSPFTVLYSLFTLQRNQILFSCIAHEIESFLSDQTLSACRTSFGLRQT
jgi:hypothetical protein